MQLDSVVSLDLCRLVLYNRQLDMVDGSFEGKENEKIGSLLNPSFMTRKSEMLMEIRQPDVPFPTYRPGGKCINYVKFHLSISNLLVNLL